MKLRRVVRVQRLDAVEGSRKVDTFAKEFRKGVEKVSNVSTLRLHACLPSSSLSQPFLESLSIIRSSLKAATTSKLKLGQSNVYVATQAFFRRIALRFRQLFNRLAYPTPVKRCFGLSSYPSPWAQVRKCASAQGSWIGKENVSTRLMGVLINDAISLPNNESALRLHLSDETEKLEEEPLPYLRSTLRIPFIRVHSRLN